MQDEIMQILKSLNLSVSTREVDNGFVFEVSNLLGMKIGQFFFNSEEESLNFNVYDPQMQGYSIEGGGCFVDQDSIKGIIDEFTYLPYEFELDETKGYKHISLGSLIKNKSVNSLDYFTNVLFEETKRSENVYFYEVPDEYYDDNDVERSYGITDAIRRLEQEKPNASVIIMHSLS